jgi:hypothetical protein
MLHPVLVTLKGCLFGFAVYMSVINAFQPGPEGLVEFLQGGNIGGFHLGHKLGP